MKYIVLTVFAALLGGSVLAQSYEIGLNGGISTTSQPHRVFYKGDDNVYNYAAGLNFHYNITDHFQIGADVLTTKWQRMDQWPLSNTNNMSLGDQDVKLVIAQSAVSFTLRFNYVLPFYDKYGDNVRSHLYFGVAAGGVVVGNDGKINYSRVNPNTPAEYTYASQYNFESGYGYLLGAQLGYTYYLGQHIGINLEIAPKVAWVRTNDSRMAGANNQYNLFYYPATIGIHYRFGGNR